MGPARAGGAAVMKYYLGPYQRDLSVPRVRRSPPAGTTWSIDLSSLPECASAALRSGVGLFAVPDALVLDPLEYELIHQGDWDTPLAARKALRFAAAIGVSSVSGLTLRECLLDALIERADPSGGARFRPLMPY